METTTELARQLISDIAYRREVTGTTSDLADVEGLANYVSGAATHVARVAVNNRWCADDQRTAFLSHHAAVLPMCRTIVRTAISGQTDVATAQLATLFRDAEAVAPGHKPAA